MRLSAHPLARPGRSGELLRTIGVLVCVLVLCACTVRQALTPQPGTDLSPLQPGTSKASVDKLFGPPIKEWKTPGGVKYGTYLYQEGTKANGGLAAANAGLTLITFGMWEIIAAKQGSLQNRGPTMPLAVSYDAADKVVDIFPEFNDLPELPPDGRRTSLKPLPDTASAPR